MKKIILMAIVFFVLGMVFWMGYSSFDKLEQKEIKKEIRIEATSSIPSLSFTDFNGIQLQLNEIDIDQSLILILFNLECEHCQYEAKDIVSNISSFNQTQIVFISPEPVQEIHDFADKYGLSGLQNVSLGQADLNDMVKLFQRISYPNIFIYNSDKELVKEFKGETKIELLVEHAHK